MNLKINSRWLVGSIPFLLIIIVWSVLTYGEFVNPLFLPTPTDVLSELIRLFRENSFQDDIGISLLRISCGFVLAVLVALPVGIIMGTSRRAEMLLYPIIGFFRYMPASAFIPLAILWLGISLAENVFIVFLSIFFYLSLMIADAAANVQREVKETAVTLGLNRFQILVNVVLPSSMPDIWNAMRTMFGVGWTMIIVIELVGAESGLGAKIMHAQRFLQTHTVIAGILVIGALGIAWDLFFKYTYRVLFPWAKD